MVIQLLELVYRNQLGYVFGCITLSLLTISHREVSSSNQLLSMRIVIRGGGIMIILFVNILAQSFIAN